MTRTLVAAVLVVAAVAALDAVLGFGVAGRAADATPQGRTESSGLVRGREHAFTLAGDRVRDRVLRNGREYLSAEAIAGAFPLPVEGPVDVAHLAVAPDGTLVLAVWRFPSGRPMETALEFWRGQRAVGAFGVPPGFVAGGLGFSPDARLVATFGPDGELRGVFDREGRRHPASLAR